MTNFAGVRPLLAAAVALLLLLPWGSAQTEIEFWHSQDATEALIQTFADEFNAEQDRYRVVPRYIGTFQEGAIRLISALRSGGAPALFDAEITVFARLVEEGSVLDLTDLAAELPSELTDDFYPQLWDYGRFGDARYGLTWSLSVPVLVYNASVLNQRGVEPPATWEALEAAADRLTTRNTRGYIDVAAGFIFEAMVTTRGGSLVDAAGEPSFVTPEALDALSMLQRMACSGHSIPRSFAEADQALVDFARGRGMISVASQAFFPQGDRFTVTFDVAAAPLPAGGTVPMTGTQLVVPSGNDDETRRGAFAFWQFLIEQDNLERWVQESFFLPLRRSVADSLEPWYAESADRSAGIVQIDRATVRGNRTSAYAVWQQHLEASIERVTKGCSDPQAALEEAQRLAQESR